MASCGWHKNILDTLCAFSGDWSKGRGERGRGGVFSLGVGRGEFTLCKGRSDISEGGCRRVFCLYCVFDCRRHVFTCCISPGRVFVPLCFRNFLICKKVRAPTSSPDSSILY